MSQDTDTRPRHQTMRSAMLDVVSRAEAARGAGGLYPEEGDLIAALQAIVTQSQSPAERLRGAYHPDLRDQLGGILARYAD